MTEAVSVAMMNRGCVVEGHQRGYALSREDVTWVSSVSRVALPVEGGKTNKRRQPHKNCEGKADDVCQRLTPQEVGSSDGKADRKSNKFANRATARSTRSKSSAVAKFQEGERKAGGAQAQFFEGTRQAPPCRGGP